MNEKEEIDFQKSTLIFLKSLYLPYFIKREQLTKREIKSARLSQIKSEILKSLLVSIFVALIMAAYLIFGFSKSAFWGSSTYSKIMLIAIIEMFVGAMLYIMYFFLSHDKIFGYRVRETIQMIFYLLIMIGIYTFYIAKSFDSELINNFSLGYIWFIALAITPPTSFVGWVITSLTALFGTITTTIVFPVESETVLINYYIIVAAYILASLIIRSYYFTSAYYKNRVIEQNERNMYLSTQDALTEIENRRGFEQFISNNVSRWEAESKTITFIMFDIDHFKKYNDTYGHAKGDECLKEVTNIIQSKFKNEPLNFYRYGGDEFTIILEEEGEENILNKTSQVIDAIRSAKINGPSEDIPYLTISLGAKSEKVTKEYKPDEQMHLADMYLYEAKAKFIGYAILNGKKIE